MTKHYSAAELMHRAEEGALDKSELADLLPSEPRLSFLAECARVERNLTRACAARGEFCLPGGCALEGETCLDAVLNAEPEYNKACGQIWLPFFQSSTDVA